ncbi:hypothetical protein CWI36_1395p0010 [Hamiltosporidium magnivora]|uniref:Uncharacterized protein n=1 Tax=Hamiltosporidium magnivora TaxID=148818 RepID=A0A4Q9L1I4_9MICR|nr:hypothetical protein CWI36_1395p0010 [Hamiltosporidium magnivora]
MKIFGFLTLFLLIYSTVKSNNKKSKETKKIEVIKSRNHIPDIVIYNDKDSSIYKRVFNQLYVERLTIYFSEIFNGYLNERTYTERILPKLKNIASECEKIADSKQKHEEFFKMVASFARTDIIHCKRLFLVKYKNDKTRNQFFDKLLEFSSNNNFVSQADFYKDIIYSSITEVKTHTTVIDLKKTFEAAINDNESDEFHIVINLLAQGFSRLIGDLICCFPNFEDLYRFLQDNDQDKLKYEIDLFSNTFIDSFFKSKSKTESYNRLPFRDLNFQVIKNSKYLKNCEFYRKELNFFDICPKKMLEMPLNRFFCLGNNQNIINAWNETDERVNPDSSISCPKKGIFQSDLTNINLIEDADNIEKLKKEFENFLRSFKTNKSKISNQKNTIIYCILNLNNFYEEFVEETTNKINEKINTIKKTKMNTEKENGDKNRGKNDSKKLITLTHIVIFNLVKDHFETADFTFETRNLFAFLEKIKKLLNTINSDFDLVIILENFSESIKGTEFCSKIYSVCEITDKDRDRIAEYIKKIEEKTVEITRTRFKEFIKDFFKNYFLNPLDVNSKEKVVGMILKDWIVFKIN